MVDLPTVLELSHRTLLLQEAGLIAVMSYLMKKDRVWMTHDQATDEMNLLIAIHNQGA
jgi:heptaprenylglyceryl phosphate synthase